MKRSTLIKYGCLFGLVAGSVANGQVFNFEDINTGFAFYGYNIMAFGQGVVSDPGNNIWNGFGNGGGTGTGYTFGGGRPNDILLHNNPGNPYTWCHSGFFAHGNALYNPTLFNGPASGNSSSAGTLTPITVPSMNYGFDSFGTPAGSNFSAYGSAATFRTNVAAFMLSQFAVVNAASPGAGTAANPLGTLVLSNVPPGTYDLYLYGANFDGTRGATFIVDSGTPSNGVFVATNPNPAPTGDPLTNFVDGVDYVVYNNVVPNPDSTIHVSWGVVSNAVSGLAGEGDFNGLQLAASAPVQAGPTIIQQPQGGTIASQGTTGPLLSVTARGNPTPTYQWYSGSPPGTQVPGQTSNTLAFNGALAGQSGNYFVVAKNVNGSATSSVASVTIAAGPLITAQSSTNPITLFKGHNFFNMSVTAFGQAPLVYYWEANGVAAAITTNSGTIQFNNVTATANYTCIVSNSFGTATNEPLSVTIVPTPTDSYTTALLALNPYADWPLTETGVGTTAYDYVNGNNGTYQGNVVNGAQGPLAGVGSPSYAYALDGSTAYVDVPGAGVNFTGPLTLITWVQCNGSILGFKTVAGKGDSSYRNDVDNSGFQAHFNDNGGNEVIGGPSLVTPFWHQIVGVYDGTNNYLYVDGTLATAPGANHGATPGNNLDFWIGGAPDYGTARLWGGSMAQVSLFNYALSAAQVQSLFNAAETPPYIYSQPVSFSGFEGGNARFTAGASGAPTLGYQWTGPGGPISGATNASLLITNLNTSGVPANEGPGTYFCTITNAFGTTNTPSDGSVALSVGTSAPFFVVDLPTVNYGIIGSPAVLSVQEAGNEPITNQWFGGASSPPTTALQNVGRISGATTPTLTINNAQVTDDGYYQLAATNNIAPFSAASQIGQLIIQSEPSFNTNGAGWSVNEGGGGGASFNNNVLTLTSGVNGQANTIFFNTPMYVGSWDASFIYQATNSPTVPTTSSLADGMTFCIQNAGSPGTVVPENGGNSLAYQGITNSAAVAFDLYNAAPGGIEFVSGGVNPEALGQYVNTPPVAFDNAHPVAVNMVYNGQTIALTMTDTITAGVFATNMNVGPMSQYVGSNTAFIGFTAATGGVNAVQTISEFSFIPLPLLTAKQVGANIVISWPVGVGGYTFQHSSSLSPASWTSMPSPYTIVGQSYQMVVPITGGSQFFRLHLGN